jgi:uncharacterized damage-inducible protein DinB
MTKEELRRRLDETRKQLLDAISQLTEEQMYRRVETGEWSVAEILAHLPNAERWLRSQAEAVRQREGARIRFLSEQERQESAGQAHRMVPPQIIHDLIGARWQTTKFLDSLTAADLDKTGVHSQIGAMTIAAIIEVIGRHEADHTRQVLRLRQKMEVSSIPG